jgi:hypothetical protein
MPMTVTSDYAEIIYFLRNGNLYRRVLLVAPERQQTILSAVNNLGYPNGNQVFPNGFQIQPSIFGGATTVSWQGVNDVSARPAAFGLPTSTTPTNSVTLNSLADLTNRENRAFSPRFGNDFVTNTTGNTPPDGFPEDSNGDNVPDFYPTLYYGILNVNNPANPLIFEPPVPNSVPLSGPPRTGGSFLTMAFPWVFPGAYTQPQSLPNNAYGYALGWIHSPTPTSQDAAANNYQFDSGGINSLYYLQNINHNPLDLGDNLPIPPQTVGNAYSNWQTWWGFPTWRETLSASWNDPTYQVNVNQLQPSGLSPRAANVVPVVDDANLLPAMSGIWRNTPQPFSDGFGSKNTFYAAATAALPGLWAQGWEDDLIMTGVRSFDVKAYDNALASYADLGWGDDPRVTAGLAQPYLGTGLQTPFLLGNYDVSTGGYNAPSYALINAPSLTSTTDVIAQTFAHEGRMPPITTDFRFDAQYGLATNYLPANSPFLPANGGTYTGNIGDNSAAIVRLRRVWDSWSTSYSRAPATGVNNITGFPVGPPYAPPVYPSYPPPYPAPLRGIQIQIRVVDPTNQRIKSLTIRQDFTDKL